MSKVFYDYYKSPIGYVELVSSDTGILKCNFIESKKESSDNSPLILKKAKEEIESYFNGSLLEFTLKLEFAGTDFQKKIWNELLKIPFGKTTTYKELAKKIDNAKAIRAVGSANGKNPISIIIPCHRVIGSNDGLRGYGGGIEKKKWLLEFEKSVLNQ